MQVPFINANTTTSTPTATPTTTTTTTTINNFIQFVCYLNMKKCSVLLVFASLLNFYMPRAFFKNSRAENARPLFLFVYDPRVSRS